MRKIYYLMAMVFTAFTCISCEDVPAPYGQPINPNINTDVVVEPSGNGTAANPYNVSGVLAFVNGLGADVTSPSDVYITGYVVEVTEAFGTQYGNATFTIGDTENSKTVFTFYRGLYLGNVKYTDDKATNIKAGDKVVVCGKVVLYKGNTPETSQGNAYVVSINGVGGGDTKPTEETKTVSVADFIAAPESTTTWYQLTGTVKNLKDGDQYGNFDIEDATGSVYLYGLVSEKGGEKKHFQELQAAKGIANGKKITIIGNRGSYNGQVQVTNAYFVSIEDGTGGDTPTPGSASGNGTLDSPFNVAAAAAAASNLADKEVSTASYYIKGKISSIKFTFSAQYGTATFNISDDGTTSSTQFTCYSVLFYNNASWAEGDTQIAVGDDVIVYGQITNYGGTLETASKKACIYSLNGKTASGGGDEPASGTGTKEKPLTASQAYDIVAAMESGKISSEDYYVKGKICSIKFTFSAQYGTATFNISDDGNTGNKEFIAYSTYYHAMDQGWKDGDTQVNVGDEVIVCGKVINYNGNTPEFASKKNYVVTINGK